jgi:hypothetical protein
MANKTYGKYTRGLRDIKITNAAGTVQEDLDAAITFTFKPTVSTAVLRGDDVEKVRYTSVSGGEGTLSAGGYSSAALAIMLGVTLAVAGSSPNETTTLDIPEGLVFPTFKIYGIARDKDGGATQVLLGNCTLTEAPEISVQDEEFHVTNVSVGVAADSNGRIVRIIQQETAAALPTS